MRKAPPDLTVFLNKQKSLEVSLKRLMKKDRIAGIVTCILYYFAVRFDIRKSHKNCSPSSEEHFFCAMRPLFYVTCEISP